MMNMRYILVTLLLIQTSKSEVDKNLIDDIFNSQHMEGNNPVNAGGNSSMNPGRYNPVNTGGNNPVNTGGNSPVNTGGNNLLNTGRNNSLPCDSGQECVSKFYCSSGERNTDGATKIDIRILSDDETVPSNVPNKCPFLQICCSKKDIVNAPIVRPMKTSARCGIRNVDGVGFKALSHPSDTEYGEFPWMVAIIREKNIRDSRGKIFHCGGSLIHPQIVLTAATCVYNQLTSDLKARAGEWEANSQNELLPHQDRQVEDITMHEDYDTLNEYAHYNVALLRLKAPFNLAPNVNLVCLPPNRYNFDFSRCVAAGWGTDKFNGEYQKVLKKVDLPIVPQNVCQKNLRNTRLGNTFNMHWTFLCAGGELGKDTCQGDGGSPLVCPVPGSENQYYQAGIVSWGVGCGDKDVPGVYTNVAALRPWIDGELDKMGIDKTCLTAGFDVRMCA